MNRILSYDRHAHLLLLSSGMYAVLVDPSLCLDPDEPMPFLREPRMKIEVLGEVERVNVRDERLAQFY